MCLCYTFYICNAAIQNCADLFSPEEANAILKDNYVRAKRTYVG